jgi:hypothetical protein
MMSLPTLYATFVCALMALLLLLLLPSHLGAQDHAAVCRNLRHPYL